MTKCNLEKVAIVVVAVALIGFTWHSFAPLSFNERQWKQARRNSDLSVMYRMSENLAQRLTADKPSPRMVVDLLGSPDRDAGFFFQYQLGKHRSFPLFVVADRWLLTIEFKNEHVSRVVVNVE